MPESESKFYFIGGQLSLDFINTEVGIGESVDFLADFADFVAWLQQAQVLDATESAAALSAWGQRPEAKRVLEQARELRSAIREMALRLAVGKEVASASVDVINRVLAQATGYYRLTRVRSGYELQFHSERTQAAHLLTPIAKSAAELLRDSEPLRIRQCGNPICSLYYYDTSKNRTRRWCSMALCGNRMKAAAFYQRAQKNKRGESGES